MKRYISMVLVVLFLFTTPVYGYFTGWYGVTRTEFQSALKQKKIVLKRSKVGKTTLFYDTKISKKRVKQIKKWIKALPPKVQKTAKKVYLLREKYYFMTGDSKLKKTYGYEIVPCKEIYIRNTRNSLFVRRVLWHEFGHAYDSRNKQFEYSSKKKWKTIVLAEYGYSNDFEEQFADIFAEYFEFLNEPENLYITKLLERK